MRKFKREKLILVNLNHLIQSKISPLYANLLNSLELSQSEEQNLYYHCIIAALLQSIQNCEQYFSKVFIVSSTSINSELQSIIDTINKNFTFKIFVSSVEYNKITESSVIINDIQNFLINHTTAISIKKTKKFLNSKGLQNIYTQINKNPTLQFLLYK